MAQMELQRRLKMAQALQETKMPEGQMIGGHFVAPSFTQQLASVYNKYQGGKAEREAMQQFGEYRKSKEQKQAEALRGFVEGMQPKATTTAQDNFVTQPLAQGMNVPTSPFGTSEQVGQTSPFGTQNMQGDMTTNQPIQATTYTPRSQQDLVSNFYNNAQKSGNPDMANKFALEQFGQAIKPKATKYIDAGDKQIEVDENNTPTGRTLPKGVAPGSDLSNQIALMRLQEEKQQHGIQNKFEGQKVEIERSKSDPLGLNKPKIFTEQDVADTAKSSGKTPQQVRQDFLAQGWKKG
jgi:hypothetical protein